MASNRNNKKGLFHLPCQGKYTGSFLYFVIGPVVDCRLHLCRKASFTGRNGIFLENKAEAVSQFTCSLIKAFHSQKSSTRFRGGGDQSLMGAGLKPLVFGEFVGFSLVNTQQHSAAFCSSSSR